MVMDIIMTHNYIATLSSVTDMPRTIYENCLIIILLVYCWKSHLPVNEHATALMIFILYICDLSNSVIPLP